MHYFRAYNLSTGHLNLMSSFSVTSVSSDVISNSKDQNQEAS